MTITPRKIYDKSGNLVGYSHTTEEEPAVEPESSVQPKSPAQKTGYGNPPKASRFKPGISGNLKGRPKTPTLREMFLSIADERLYEQKDVERFGYPDRSRLEGAMAALFKEAAHGDAKAIREIFDFHRQFVGEDEHASISGSDEIDG